MNRLGTSVRRVLFALAGFTLAVAGAQAAPANVHDGVVIDTASNVAYTTHPGSGMRAVDLASGRELWRSEDAAKPLTLVGNDLVAQGAPGPRGELQLAVIDPATGIARYKTAAALPQGIVARLGAELAGAFVTWAEAGAEGSAVVHWSFEPSTPRGISPDQPLVEGLATVASPAAPASRRGSLRLDLTTGTLSPQATAAGNRPANPLLTELAGSDSRRFASVDGRHVLESRRLPAVAGSPNRYRWTVRDGATQAVLGQVDAPVSAAPFVVAEGAVLFVTRPTLRKEGDRLVDQALALRALELSTGKERFAVTLLDTAFRGPFPP
ncbi:MAG: hypothetical protein SF066_10210 [Thermoanaerobaculia bacterium]|nr:hypothetical protein [Thermoanaerobaculia bacterium]